MLEYVGGRDGERGFHLYGHGEAAIHATWRLPSVAALWSPTLSPKRHARGL